MLVGILDDSIYLKPLSILFDRPNLEIRIKYMLFFHHSSIGERVDNLS
jgi:hypothetical protein